MVEQNLTGIHPVTEGTHEGEGGEKCENGVWYKKIIMLSVSPAIARTNEAS
jgi:hypothetical protein